MDLKEIKQLIKLMVDHELTELDIDEGDRHVHLRRGGEAPVAAAPLVAAPPAAAVGAAEPAASTQGENPPETLTDIRSPMVGTFYAKPSPDSEAFVTVGSPVTDDAVVCVVEAMKVMNEIRADCSGTVAEICAKNAQPVEYGQVLFRVRPA